MKKKNPKREKYSHSKILMRMCTLNSIIYSDCLNLVWIIFSQKSTMGAMKDSVERTAISQENGFSSRQYSVDAYGVNVKGQLVSTVKSGTS